MMELKSVERDRSKELKNCDIVKCILMILVVLGHSMGMWMTGGWGPFEANQSSAIIHYLADWVSTFHVYAFTLVSGYIFYYVKYERGGYIEYAPFIISKLKRLIVPFYFILLVWVIPVHIYFYGFDFNALFHQFILAEAPNQLWFLLMLFWVFILFWPVSDYARNHLIGGTIISLLFMAVGIGLTFVPNIFVFRTGLQYVLFFWVGFLIRQYGSDYLMKVPLVIYIVVDIVLFAIYEYLRQIDGIIFTILTIGISVLLHLVGAVMAFVLLQRLVAKLSSKGKVLPFLAKHSMAIYLVHQQVIYFVIKMTDGGVSPYMQVIFNFIVALGVSLIFAVLMSKTKITRHFIGSK